MVMAWARGTRRGRWRWALVGMVLTGLVAGCTTSPPPPPTPTPAGPDWLWVAVWGETKVVAFDDAQLAVGGDAVTPRRAFGLGTGNDPYSIAFDAEGNLWVGTQAGSVLRIDAADLRVSGTPVPGVSLDTSSTDVNGMAFGTDGRLWVATAAGLLAYRPDQLLTSGTPAPDVHLMGTVAHPLSFPTALTFDAGGGLWVAAGDFVARYAPSQLTASGAPEPDVVLESDGASLADARGVAFDPGGALWVAGFNGSGFEKFRPQDILVSGTPSPVVRIDANAPYPSRVVFDDEGNLWGSHVFGPGFVGSGYVGMVEAANLVSSGPAVVAVGFTDLGGIDSGGTILFAPEPE